MSESVVNLNKVRKVRAKTQARADAAANRVQFGLTKHQKSLALTLKLPKGDPCYGAPLEEDADAG